MNHLNLDTQKMARVVLEGEQFVKKTLSAINNLEEKYTSLRADSPQAQNFKKQYGILLEDLGVIRKRLDNTAKGLAERRRELETLENSDEIFAAAAASQTETKKTSAFSLGR